MPIPLSTLTHADRFAARHIGPTPDDVRAMLAELGYDSLDALIDAVVPDDIRLKKPLNLPAAKSEYDALTTLRALAAKNQVFRSYIGMGYADCITPPVVLRNVLENPGWYTAYTPYQAEIAQGRLEALLNFQTGRYWMNRPPRPRRCTSRKPRPRTKAGPRTWWTNIAIPRPSRSCRRVPRPAAWTS